MRTVYKVLLIFFSLIFLSAAGGLTYITVRDGREMAEMDDLRLLKAARRDTAMAAPTVAVTEDGASVIVIRATTEESPVQGVAMEGAAAAEAAEARPPAILPEYVELYERNPDFAGWVKIEGTAIDFPVMYTPEEPEKYLRRLFDGKESSAGVPFIGAGGRVFPQSDTVVLFSHNRRNGTMFADIAKYAKPAYGAEHAMIQFDTLYSRGVYEVFAVFQTVYDKRDPQANFQYYAYPDFENEQAFDDYVAQICAMALYDTGVTPVYGEKLLLLSTCAYFTENGRIVVAARRAN